MFKNIFSFSVFLKILLFVIWTALYGSLLKHHYEGGDNLQSVQKIAVTIAEIPRTAEELIKNIKKGKKINKPPILTKHKDKKRFEQFIENKRNALLVLPKYDHSLNRSIVDIIDLNNFEIIHTYKHNINEMNDQVMNINEFQRLKIDNAPIRFVYQHPLLFEDGSLTGVGGPAYKIGFCSNLKWINDEERFHHSQMLDYEGNIWVGGEMNPKSKYVKEYSVKNFIDDSIIKINTDGKILFNKSVTEILIENNLDDENIFHSGFDPIHLNDIEPVFNNTEYWKKGDVFISIRHQSAIIHYRPSSNEVINYLTGPFAQQHDVDIISDKEISIFNNNNVFVDNKHSEVVIYNFETKKFRKLFNEQLQKKNFKTVSEGLSHVFKDGALLVDESNHARIILLNNKGETEWEFVNKNENGDIGFVSWSRVIEDEIFIEKFKSLVKNKKCLN